MNGIAYTFGTHTDKEIHFSLDHIRNSAQRAKEEILGVLTHEVVHCFQYNGKDKCPGGLIEGMAGSLLLLRFFCGHHFYNMNCVPSVPGFNADWVRLHTGLIPPHWKPTGGDKWDAGYQTTAYFLDWLEERYGRGTIQALNQSMRDREYEEIIFREVTGRRVEKLWRFYCEDLKRQGPV